LFALAPLAAQPRGQVPQAYRTQPESAAVAAERDQDLPRQRAARRAQGSAAEADGPWPPPRRPAPPQREALTMPQARADARALERKLAGLGLPCWPCTRFRWLEGADWSCLRRLVRPLLPLARPQVRASYSVFPGF